jgi:hypothetical protein
MPLPLMAVGLNGDRARVEEIRRLEQIENRLRLHRQSLMAGAPM